MQDLCICLAATMGGLWKFHYGKKWLLCFENPLLIFFPCVFPDLSFLYDIWWLLNSNYGLDVCYGDDPIVGRIGYIHEVSAHLLFIYGVWLILKLYDFE
jgi:hypothetical protein